jgi:hypothetical protein
MVVDKKARKKDDRTKNWTFIVYLDCVSNWRDIINAEHVSWAESPIHDKDITEQGEQKKPHIHVVLMYEGNKSFEQIKELTDKIGSPIPQKVGNIRGIIRYLCHLDDPNKAQYDVNQVKTYNGADLKDYLKPKVFIDKYDMVSEMMEYVDANGITEISALLRYARSNRRHDWFVSLCDNTAFVMSKYLDSIRHMNQKKGGSSDEI